LSYKYIIQEAEADIAREYHGIVSIGLSQRLEECQQAHPIVSEYSVFLEKSEERIKVLSGVIELEEKAVELREKQKITWDKVRGLEAGGKSSAAVGVRIASLKEVSMKDGGKVEAIMEQVKKLREEGGMPELGVFEHAMEGIVPDEDGSG
jgi:hypothetical protein